MIRYILLACLLLSALGYAQDGINYKAVIKDDLGNVIANSSVDIKFKILESDAQTNVYEEVHNLTTDSNGIIILNVGEGTIINGIFNAIDWGKDVHFLNVKIDTGSGFINLGTTQFSAVPYALNARKASNVKGLEPIDEGNGFGWRLIDRNINNYDNIGFNAIDLSFVDDPNLGFGATGNYAFSLGYNGTASGEHAFAFGNQNYALNNYAVALGNNNSVFGLNSTAIGGINQVSGDYAFAAGLQSQALDNYSFAMGNNAIASGEYAVAFGNASEASGNFSFVMGDGSRATAHNSIAMGQDALAEVTDAIALGNSAVASASGAFAAGTNTEASGNGSMSLGFGAESTGLASVAMGRFSIASQSSAVAIGHECLSSGIGSVSMGSDSRAIANYSLALGQNAQAVGSYSTAIGSHTLTAANYSAAIGYGTITGNQGEVSVGSFNKLTNNDGRIFVVGNGTFINDIANRSNAMVVYANGNVGIGVDEPQEQLHISERLRIGTETIEDTGSNQLTFGASLIPSNNNVYRLGNSSSRWIGVWATDGTINTSDRREKKNIKNLSYGLKEVLKMKPVSFNWKDKTIPDTKLGLIAQDLQVLVPEVVKTHVWKKNEASDELTKEKLERLGVYYSDLIPVLIKAIQEQQDIISNLNSKIDHQKKIILSEEAINLKQSKSLEALLTRVNALEQSNN